mmetsp:Transcript_20007/g.41523  ORF Transcript_20007/g.41523 Transcript_20007/m.41523 type:complete len:96 (-) Transcript_20007:48-335(-)
MDMHCTALLRGLSFKTSAPESPTGGERVGPCVTLSVGIIHAIGGGGIELAAQKDMAHVTLHSPEKGHPAQASNISAAYSGREAFAGNLRANKKPD